MKKVSIVVAGFEVVRQSGIVNMSSPNRVLSLADDYGMYETKDAIEEAIKNKEYKSFCEEMGEKIEGLPRIYKEEFEVITDCDDIRDEILKTLEDNGIEVLDIF
ncbi:hypothetical protein [Bacillus bombysepticus]|uniref:hypothetical protein n=1 Tax=Bacillus bombysepticus TaxID=658666 RepID=UPI0030185BCA